jgi:hypothetical protein
VWLPDVQPLLRLPAVASRLEELPDGREAKAVSEVLTAAVQSMGPSQYRRLLEIVLGLDPAYEHLSAQARRERAGKEFRGGHRPVAAGTIRQYHEPRALAELASLLSAQSDEGNVSSTAISERRAKRRIEWHPDVRATWAGERLRFWLMSLPPEAIQPALGQLEEIVRSAGVREWVAYDLYGAYDLAVAGWVPRDASSVAQAIDKALRPEAQLEFLVQDVVFHSSWAESDGVMRRPTLETLQRGPPSFETPGDTETDSAFSLLERENILTRTEDPSGFPFLVVIGTQHPWIGAGGKDHLTEKLRAVLAQAPPPAFTERALYTGVGGGWPSHIITGRIAFDSFPALHASLIGPINEVVVGDARARVFVGSGGTSYSARGIQFIDAPIAPPPQAIAR